MLKFATILKHFALSFSIYRRNFTPSMVRVLLFGSGTISGIGKGNTSGAFGKILINKLSYQNIRNTNHTDNFCSDDLSYKIVPIKIDPYLNTTPSTINPVEHGEVFVLEDGTETDMDFGVYERNFDLKLSGSNNITGGKLFDIMRKNENIWNGQTITFEKMFFLIEMMIIEAVSRTCLRNYKDYVHKKYKSIEEIGNDVIILLEIGGSITDLENVIFVNFLSNLKERLENGSHIFKVINIDLLVKQNGELKTKLIQKSLASFRQQGIPSNMTVCRVSGFKWLFDKSESQNETSENLKPSKIKLFETYKSFHDICDYLKTKNIKNPIISPDMINTYNLPYIFDEQGAANRILKMIGITQSLNGRILTFTESNDVINENHNVFQENIPRIAITQFNPYPWLFHQLNTTINVGIVIKYSKNLDSYKSVIDSLLICGLMEKAKINIIQIDAEQIEKKVKKEMPLQKCLHAEKYRAYIVSDFFKDIDVVIIPGGFGIRGTEGKILAIEYCRMVNLPVLGICLGFQLTIIEFLRNVLSINVNSEEFLEKETQVLTDQQTEIFLADYDKDTLFDKTNFQKAIKMIEGVSRFDKTMRLGEKISILKENSQVFEIYDKFTRVRRSAGQLFSKMGYDQIKLQTSCLCGFCGEDFKCSMSYTGVNILDTDQISDAIQQLPQNQIFLIEERHRHRYEVNPAFIPLLEKHNFHFVGRDLFNGNRFTIFENRNQDFNIGIQYHPEMTTDLKQGHPLFRSLIQEGIKNTRSRNRNRRDVLNLEFLRDIPSYLKNDQNSNLNNM
ncbi:cTP synthase [Pseudoloma neurophilia]|uniref:CTP synthase n=1 Tax=Pseudoloma neurophilia TaxID=146866 RepID=A0A0R0LYW9_9MICR|nr:cTP synthase [Pseudoloma neurophilia]